MHTGLCRSSPLSTTSRSRRSGMQLASAMHAGEAASLVGAVVDDAYGSKVQHNARRP